MIHNVKILGAGSIGNHLAHASRTLGWAVTVCDVNDVALQRMKNDIYPMRYGRWDPTIQLVNTSDAPVGGFDLIIVGTPPDTHLPLALSALKENPRAILVEKPLCKPDLELADEFYRAVQDSGVKVFVGYDHVVGRATRETESLVKSGAIGSVVTLDVEFREHWAGIFKAHPWLSGPEDTYLGYWQRGGGASGEHSHAINLWQHFAHVFGFGRVSEVSAMVNYIQEGRAVYDNLCLMDLRTEKGIVGRLVQDVVTIPSRKRAIIQGTEGTVVWVNNYNPEGDAVLLLRPGRPDEILSIPKTRPDDFIEELKHVTGHLTAADYVDSGISIERGLETMLVVAASHLSEKERRRVQVDHSRGFASAALY